jgi:hypothetical protein
MRYTFDRWGGESKQKSELFDERGNSQYFKVTWPWLWPWSPIPNLKFLAARVETVRTELDSFKLLLFLLSPFAGFEGSTEVNEAIQVCGYLQIPHGTQQGLGTAEFWELVQVTPALCLLTLEECRDGWCRRLLRVQ